MGKTTAHFLLVVRITQIVQVRIPLMMKNDRNPIEATAASEQTQKRRMEEVNRKKLKLAYSNVLKTYEGREVILHLLDLTQNFVSSFNTNALSMAYAEGRRSVGLDILRQIDPESYQQLLKEQYERIVQRH